MITVNTKPDAAFLAMLAEKPQEWARRAIVGNITRAAYHDVTPVELEALDRAGLGRATTDDERAAWSFGFGWVDRTPR